jgi:hypothetical protein
MPSKTALSIASSGIAATLGDAFFAAVISPVMTWPPVKSSISAGTG